MVYENIIVERKDSVGIITLNRPKALNALSADLTRELESALQDLDNDDAVGCMISVSYTHLTLPTNREV